MTADIGVPAPAGPAMPLTAASTGQEVMLVRTQGGRRLQHRLAEMGLRPGARFRVLTRGNPGPFIISVKDTRLVIGHGIAHCVWVRPAPGGDRADVSIR